MIKNRFNLKLILIIVSLLFINSFIVFAAIGPLSCEVTENCGYGDILHLYQSTNSHAQLVNNSGYNYSVCCRDTVGTVNISGSCNGEYENISNLNKVNNSHAELANYSNYDHKVCINTVKYSNDTIDSMDDVSLWSTTDADNFNIMQETTIKTEGTGSLKLTIPDYYGFDYRKQINISSSAALTNFPVNISIDTQSLISAGKMNASCKDIRFVNNSNNQLFSYWIESGCNTTSTSIWVNVSSLSIGTNTIYVYYGNLSAPKVSNGTNTFILFDEFDTSAQWTTSDSRIIVDTTDKRVEGTVYRDYDSRLYHQLNTPLTGDFHIQYKVQWYSTPGNWQLVFFELSNTNPVSRSSNPANSVSGHFYQSTNPILDFQLFNSTGDGVNPDESSGSIICTNGQWYNVQSIRNGTTLTSKWWDSAHSESSPNYIEIWSNIEVATYNYFRYRNEDTNSSEVLTFYSDNITIRKYTSIGPTITIGSEETALNDNITRDFGAGNEIDMSTVEQIRFDIRSSRTGMYLQFGFGESDWTNTNVSNITINSANTWETKIINISNISSSDKDSVRYVGFILNNNNDFTMFIDNITTSNNTNDGYLFCYYAESCDAYETCLMTFYNYSNSHVGNCGVDGGIKVCCNLDECINNSDCAINNYCWGGDCYVNETITINNLGQTGFEQTNQEYTSSRAVVLSLTYDIRIIDKCKYSNDNIIWSSWEICQPFKFWYLSDGDELKYVYYETNRTDGTSALTYDTIYLESEGRYLDVTKPSYPTIIDEGNYTNGNTSLFAYWYGANDPELYFIGKQLEYAYKIYDNTTSSYLNNSWTYISTAISVNVTGLDLVNNHTYTFEIRVNNSANLTSSSMSDGIIVDIVAPNMTLYSSHTRNNWSSNNTIYFNWTVSESTLRGFSLVFDKISNTIPDKVIDIGLYHARNNTQVASEDGIYYYHIRAKDLADNWGNAEHYGYIGIDTTPPERPVVDNPQRFALSTNMTFSWTTYDASSGVINVSLNVTEINSSAIFFAWLGNVTSYNITNATINKSYFATVTAKDRVNLTRESETIVDLNAPVILFSKPNGSIRNYPIIVLITDEKAICEFNNTKFEYTNSTYHETRLKNLQNGVYQLSIKCTDMVGYSTIHNIDFSLTKGQQTNSLSLGIPINLFVYDIINVTLDTDIGEIRKGEIEFYINNIKYEDFTIFDKGNGNYFLLFKLENPSTFTINVSIDNIMNSSSITINDLLLTINYSESLTAKNKTRLTFGETDSYTIGIASESRKTNVKSNTHLELSSGTDENSYIFVTKTGRYLEQKILHLERKTFEEYTQAFGYGNDEKNKNKIMLDYNTIIVQDITDMFKGRNTLLLKNLGLNNKNQTQIGVVLKND